MTKLSGSKLPIARHCRWWLRPDVGYPELPRSQAASQGVDNHMVFASYVEQKVFPPMGPSQRLLANHMRQFWGDRVLSVGWEAEVSYALDPVHRRARRLGKSLDRNYGELGPTEIPLTVDYAQSMGSIPIVGDWKTGHASHVEPAETNLQLLAGACALTHATGTTDKGCVLEIVKVQESGAWPDTFIASPLVLARAMAELAHIVSDASGEPARAGDHCRYCPARGACPETGRAAAEVLPRSVERGVQWTTEFVSDANDALLVEELSAIKKAIDAIEDALKERASKKGGIYLPNGKVWKAVLSSRSSLDKEKVEEFLGERYAECLKVTQYEQFRQVKA